MPKVKARSRYIPKHVKDAVRKRDKNCCRKCGDDSYLEFDHITPYSKDAPNTVENIQLLCRKCNLAKGNRTPKCERCGNWIPNDASFCQKCGSRQQFSRFSGNLDVKAYIPKAIGILLLLYVVIYLLSNAK
jgi:RNA polymerase subunit RPABC4/transcription elongation factor Spt4